MLKMGRTVDEIVGELLIARNSVKMAIIHICRQEGVRDRHALAKKLGWGEPPLNELERRVAQARAREDQIEPLLPEGLMYCEIAAKLGMSERLVCDAARRIYARHGVAGREARRELAKKLGVELGGRYGVEREIRERLLVGQKLAEIMQAMGMSWRAVVGRCGRIYKKEGVRGRRGLFEKMQKSELGSTPDSASPIATSPIPPLMMR